MKTLLLIAIGILAQFGKQITCTDLAICTTCECYKKFDPNPTFCQTTSNCQNPGPSGIPEHLKSYIVDKINHYRSKAAKGTMVNGLPGAKGLPSVEYDDTIAITAQRFTDQCSSSPHDSSGARYDPRGYVGQNGASTSDVNGLTTAWIDTFVALWANESKYIPNNLNVLSSYQSSTVPGIVYGHYTQLVWEKSWKVGCGFSISKAEPKSRFYCNFLQGGNIREQPVYATTTVSSEICQSCPRDTQCNSNTKLCDSTTGNGPQFRTIPTSGLDCSPAESTCATYSGQGTKITKQRTYEDEYLHITLQPGESANFGMVPKSGTNGITVEYRYGNLDLSAQPQVNKPVITAWFNNRAFSIDLGLISYYLGWTKTTLGFPYVLTFEFVVSNPNSAPMYIDIRRVTNKQ